MNKNDFAPLPPMGWNSYDYYDTTVTEENIRQNADYLAKHLKPYGWEYVVVDIQWYAHQAGSRREQYQYIPFSHLEMDEYARLQPDLQRFPSSANGAGFAPLAEYIHSLGLKFGIHIMRGIPRIAAHLHSKIENTNVDAAEIADPTSICGWNPDMYGVRNTKEGQAYYDSLIALYASWGVDFIKCDDICNTSLYPNNPYSGKHEIEMIANAIKKCGRPIVLSLSPGPALVEQSWHYKQYANMWRITDDFWDHWDLLKEMFHRCELWQDHIEKGCYPDCDMLPLGFLGKGFGKERTTNFTKDEQRTMLTLWCLFGSPLMLGAELTKLDDWTLSLLTNRDLLKILTYECKPTQLRLTNEDAVWTAHNAAEHSHYVALFNLSDETKKVSVAVNSLSLSATPTKMLNLWNKKRIPFPAEHIEETIPAHGCYIYQILF